MQNITLIRKLFSHSAPACLLTSLSIVSSTLYAQENAKPCRYINSLKLSFQNSQQQALVVGSINQNPATFLIDTGAFDTSIAEDYSEKIQLDLGHTQMSSFGIGGESRTYKTKVREFSIGPLKGRAALLRVSSELNNHRYNGLIGRDFLFQSDLEISVKDAVLRFFTPQSCDNAHLAYWDKNANVVPLELSSKFDTNPTFIVKINGQDVRAILDTGAMITVIDRREAKRVGMEAEDTATIGSTLVGVGKQSVASQLFSFKRFELGAEVIENASIHSADLWSNVRKQIQNAEFDSMLKQEAQLIIGMDFIREHRILFALSQKQLYLSYLGGPLFEESRMTPPKDTPTPSVGGETRIDKD